MKTILMNNNWPLGGHMKTALFVATFLATAIGSPITAFAANDKVFAGAACVAEQGPQLSALAYPFGAVQNQDGTKTTTVNCPIVRDNTTNQNGATVTVRLNFGSAGTQGKACGLWSFDPNKVPPGAFPQGFLTTQQFPGISSPGTITSIKLSLSSSNSLGQYVLFCQLPPGASVISYLVSEPD